MGAAGTVIGALGIGLAAPPLVYIGVAMVSALAVSGLWILLAVNTFLSRFPFARREVSPRPLTAGTPGRVTVSITAGTRRGTGTAVRRAIADALDIREQASAELTGGLGTKATVTRSADSLSLSYALLPSRRGRWPLGPALVHTSDPLGMIWTDTTVGRAELIPVWPAVVDLSATAGALMGHADRVMLGARTPSPDDAALRDYREGDDLRRVHWPSTARTGTMMVRSDERAGRRPATVIVDLPRQPNALEWSISAAASIALSVLESGHPVRLLGGTIAPDRIRHLDTRQSEEARAHLLNHTVDLVSAVSSGVASQQLIAAVHHARDDLVQGEVVVGIFEPLDKASLDALAPLGHQGHAWAIVRSEGSEDQQASASCTALRRAGWRVTSVTTSDHLETVWTTLITSGDVE